MSLSVAVFAHNEEHHIARCLYSVLADAGPDAAVHVLVNGSRDGTARVAREVAKADGRVRVHEITKGDKCNAWNVFVHDIRDQADVYAFVDGDVRVASGALPILIGALADPTLNAAAAVPFSGRSAEANTAEMLRHPGVAGNLYALPARFVERIRAQGIRLPVGLVGDDSLVGSLAGVDLGRLEAWDYARIKVCPRAGFEFDSLDVSNPRHFRQYWRRLVRYSVRRFENMMIRVVLEEVGPAGLPATARELHRAHFAACQVGWRGDKTLFDLIAYRRIRNSLQ
ncbi:MAG: glycosyltransferase family 2 protein [Solirubrobacterales bacterium]